ncbi:MAG: beta-lactamase family protein [Oscillospiraceae bacterium]|nr:beta-lactamase family protein [Oscillospiraceae bacterium]
MKKPNKLFGRFAAVLCAAGIIFSMYTTAASAEERTCPSGLSFDKVDTFIEQMAESYGTNTASLSAVVFCGDETLSACFLGETDRENHIPADDNSVYEWGSISKTMIWVSAMQLWEQGKLDLDADIKTYLPDDFFQNLSYDGPITMTDLMNHTGGWCETTYSIGVDDENNIPTLEEALRLTEPAQTYRPGEVASYSNWGAALAAYIVERISGIDYCEYVHQNILKPLGMEHTAVSVSHKDNEWVFEQRSKLKSYKFNVLTQEYESLGNRMSYITLYPSGSVTGTIGDLAKYAQAFVDDNAPLFKNKETQDKLFSGSVFYGGTDIPSHSYGFAAAEYAVRTFGHNGATISCISYMLFDRESKLGVVALTNETEGNYVYNEMPAWIFGKLSPDKYSDGNNEPCRLGGYYLLSRSNASGLLKFYSYLTAVPAENLEGLSRIGDNLYQLSGDETAMLIGGKTYSDGSMGLSLGTSELIPEKMYTLKLCALTAFFMTAAASVFILLIKIKMNRANKLRYYTGIGIITAGQAAKIISAASVVALTSFAAREETYGLSKAVGASVGVIQIVCTVLCVFAAVVSVYVLLAKKPAKLDKFRYIVNIAGNALTVFVIAYFDMYKFLEC